MTRDFPSTKVGGVVLKQQGRIIDWKENVMLHSIITALWRLVDLNSNVSIAIIGQ